MRPIAFYPELAKELGSIEAALYFQQLHYWSDKGGRTDGFIYKTKEEIEEETTLSRYQQDTCRKLLIERGFIETKLIKANGAPTLHYKCLRGIEVLISKKLANGKVRNSLILDKQKTSDSITETTHRLQQGTDVPIEIVSDVEKRPPKVKHPAFEVFTVFRDVTGYFPAYWARNKTIRQSADSLHLDHGIDKIRRALLYYMENKDLPFCPEIVTPFDLETKWKKLSNFKKKNGD